MLIRIPALLDADEVALARSWLAQAPWQSGDVTAGPQARQVKNNAQVPATSAAAQQLQALVLQALDRSALFFSAALPRKVFPPTFNRYGGTANAYGSHVDQSIRLVAGTGDRVRTDCSATLFLADPDRYEGGELVIEDTFGEQRIKWPAGDLVLYPGTSVHRVEPVTRGTRLAAFFWVESMVRSDEQRRLLFELDMSLMRLRERHGDDADTVRLTGTYHNLLRMWAST